MKLYDFGIVISIGLLALIFLSAVGVTSIIDEQKKAEKIVMIVEVE